MLGKIFSVHAGESTDEVRYTRFPVKPAIPRVSARTSPPLSDQHSQSLQAERASPVKQVVRVVSGSNEGDHDIPVSTLHRALPSRVLSLKV
ncbi:MAG: hypothetical protein AAF636_05110 [Pseudomonadota bacterium]